MDFNDLLNLEDIKAEKAYRAKNSLRSFVRQAWHVVEPTTIYVSNWHIDAICDHLESVTTGHIRNLLINMPPRSGKSLIISVFWPMWEWVSFPSTRWIFSSYAMNLAIRDSLKCRRLIESEWYQENWGTVFSLSEDQNVKSMFENNRSGMRLCTSVGSAITGFGAERLVCDDPLNVTDANSTVARQNCIEWWDYAMSTRLNNPATGSKVIVQQRIHQNDLSGHVLEQGDSVHLNLPAEYEAHRKCTTSIGWSDPRKKEGELLWKERLPKDVLDSLKKAMGSIAYAGQYQQRPMPSAGGQFQKNWFHSYTVNNDILILDHPEQKKYFNLTECNRFITVDLAISLKQSADYTVIASWGLTPEKDLFLCDLIRERMDNPDQQKKIIAAFEQFQPDFIKIESVAYQLSLVQQLRKIGLPIREYKPVKDKVSRAVSASVYYEAAKVYHPKWSSWLGIFEEELLLFPNATHDDLVDVTSSACEEIYGGKRVGGMIIDMTVDHVPNLEIDEIPTSDIPQIDAYGREYKGITDQEAITLWL
jgi:predicted phage terminase large subunit-like protein